MGESFEDVLDDDSRTYSTGGLSTPELRPRKILQPSWGFPLAFEKTSSILLLLKDTDRPVVAISSEDFQLISHYHFRESVDWKKCLTYYECSLWFFIKNLKTLYA